MKFLAVSRLAEKLIAGREKSEEGSRKYEIISVSLCVCSCATLPSLLSFSQESELQTPFARSFQDAPQLSNSEYSS